MAQSKEREHLLPPIHPTPWKGERKVWTPAAPEPVRIWGPVPPSHMESLHLDEGLKAFRHPEEQKEALVTIAGLDYGRVIAASQGDKIVGYVTFHPPEEGRWKPGAPVILELGAIEVAAPWRQRGISSLLLEETLDDPGMERHIIVCTLLCWHWDLKGTGLDLWQYQKMMHKLMGGAGLVRYGTDDPEVLAHPANMLMVRVGSKVAEEDVNLFESLLFLHNWMI